MRINHNLMAMNTHRSLSFSQRGAAKSISKLSTGLRINRAADDAAGLSISEKMRAQIRGLNQASRNAQDGINLLQTAEGGLTETSDILQRMRELAVQSANGTLTKEDRLAVDAESKQLKTEIDRISKTTEYNNTQLLNGSLAGAGGGEGVEVSGAAVFKGTKGKLISSASKPFVGTAADYSKVDSLIIDGTRIDIEWKKVLSDAEITSLQAVNTGTANVTTAESKVIREIFESAINRAIDESGTGVSYVDVTDATAGVFQIESLSKGSDSTVELYLGTTAGATLADGITQLSATVGVGGSLLTNLVIGTAGRTTGSTSTDGTWQTNIAITAGDAFNVTYNGQNFKTTIISSIGVGSEVSSLADAIESAINTQIAELNSATSSVIGDDLFLEDVIIQVTDEGRLEIQAPSGDFILTEAVNNTILDDQGLSLTAIEESGQGAITFQIGANKGQELGFSINDMGVNALGVSGVNVATSNSAQAAIDTIEAAITKVSAERGKIGAIQNRLEHTIRNLDTSAENLQASESQIRDVDMAKEMMTFTKNNILTQAAQSMLAQANQSTQGVLSLLQ